METVDDFIGEGKPLADRWRELLHREYVPKSDLLKLVNKAKKECKSVDAVWLVHKIEKLLEGE